MAYEWDVFLSYPRRAPIGPWVSEHFRELLVRWLSATLTNPPRIFFDSEIEEGKHWPKALADALSRSKCMVAVWAPPYFGSRWCVSEWQAMRAREAHLGIDGLIHPIRFIDGDTFPSEARETQSRDYSEYNELLPGASRHTKKYKALASEVKRFCEALAPKLEAPPPWDPAWPVLETPTAFDASLSLDRVKLQ